MGPAHLADIGGGAGDARSGNVGRADLGPVHEQVGFGGRERRAPAVRAREPEPVSGGRVVGGIVVVPAYEGALKAPTATPCVLDIKR